MVIDDKKKQVTDILRRIQHLEIGGSNPAVLKAVNELEQDIAESFYTVVVLGEFKRGKSTFINALLGKSILPMDVLPETATINAIMYADEPQLFVVYKDGHEEVGDVSYEYLKQFSARQGNELINDIKYIKLGYPNELLKNRVILVDTPGVSDLNEQRSEVTFNFVPKANAVIFLLDAMSPLKKTEKDFIEERLLPFGINNIVFVANRYDSVDEEEEPDYLSDLKQRLLNAFKMDSKEAELRDITLYPLSALNALRGIERGDNTLLELSGLSAIKEKLRDMIFNGNVEQDKLLSYRNRLLGVLKSLQRDLDNDLQLKQTDKSELEQMSRKLSKMMEEAEANKASVAEYTKTAKERIYAMADKSINFFNEKLQEDINDMVEAYQGTGFKEYIEGTVTKHIKRSFENWVAMYTPHIDQLVSFLETELARGLSYHFRQNIRIETVSGREMETAGFHVSLEAEDISGVNFQAGAIAAAGSIGLMVLVGGAVMPLISFAALPFLRDKMLKERLAAAKADIFPEMASQIAQFALELRNVVHGYVDKRCEAVCNNTEYAYEAVLKGMKERIDEQILEKERQGQNKDKEIAGIIGEIEEVNKMMRLLKQEGVGV